MKSTLQTVIDAGLNETEALVLISLAERWRGYPILHKRLKIAVPKLKKAVKRLQALEFVKGDWTPRFNGFFAAQYHCRQLGIEQKFVGISETVYQRLINDGIARAN